MSNTKIYFILAIIGFSVFSCQKSNEDQPAPPRDYAVQYAADKDSIENYLKKNYLTPVLTDGYDDIQVEKIPAGGTQTSIWDNTTYPLQSITVTNDNRQSYFVDGKSKDVVSYKLYYLVIKPGGGIAPNALDSTYTTYKGWTLNNKTFDSNNTPIWSTYPPLSSAETSLISGYRQILNKVKTAGNVVVNPDGTVDFNNSGIVVVFIPSGLGYFNTPRASIPSYSCIVFRIRVHTLRKRDHDRDGIMSFNEDINNDNDYFNDDTDGDNIPDFLDLDDDGDAYLTKAEIKRPDILVGSSPVANGYYPFTGAAVDDPSTPNIDERQGIPRAFTGPVIAPSVLPSPLLIDFTEPTRIRRHLDKLVKPPYL
jgi:FKBP-type peptidyl-prolyl cis-trans isomerase FkpA